MYACLCNALKEKDIKLACAGCTRPCAAEDVFTSLGCKPDCGNCLDFIDEVIIAETAHQYQTAP